jgi:hypothetical protein
VLTHDEQASLGRPAPIRPSRRWYWVACGILVGAAICIAFAVAGAFSLNHQIQGFQRVSVPGQDEVTFGRPGEYVLYIEEAGRCCSVTFGDGSPPFSDWSMKVALQPVNGGPPVELSTWRGFTQSYAVSGHEGQSAMSFTISEPGKYALTATDVTPTSITNLAVGRRIGGTVIRTVVLGIVGVFALLAALVTGLVTALRRRRARRLPSSTQVMAPPGDRTPGESVADPDHTRWEQP